ncbi:MAG: type II toxin-antitoxin system death-on-curing family toxin [Rhodobacteraceae bacterium]|nr:type II toxin-antitoxin system death-on-curing family toxin [Paracoccaceae bacterium]
MTLHLLSVEVVELIHDEVLNLGELTGRALDKSLEGALARVDNRLAYGMVNDVFDLAAAYCVAVATGHCFNDGNKRTAHQCLDVVLDINGAEYVWNAEEAGNIVIQIAQGLIDEDELAHWLRNAPYEER